jgi:hypothetical protein
MENTQRQSETKTLAAMTAEVVQNNRVKGWHDNPPLFPEAMAMLHSEVSEALEAWRQWGLDDHTHPGHVHTHGYGPALCKPEGVGSEFADILIRLLDDAWLFGQVNLEAELRNVCHLALTGSFPANINKLHDLISTASYTAAAGTSSVVSSGTRLAAILVFLRQLCEEYDIDLNAEYERKMAFNKTRAFRHGGKRL